MQQAGGKHVQRHDALFGLGARHSRTVQGRRGVALTKPPHEDILAILHPDATDALHRLRGVAIGLLEICSAVTVFVTPTAER